ncbi:MULTISPECIES: type VI secretion system Vgr family protein [Vibrio]|uniref:Type IV secretion protein Rhs n=1 Tax=Vibrio tasmaniensis TaxID=212663 RepID=A0A2N7NNR6_9VIBR|nr:type VI secretion system tip protein TssI/VgrG [Vibrio tasmaniensis]PMP18566.1 type IV secretion protein Rhs [Vibrio tasmaniensis]TKG30597.1 type VI secretion system tip protein VgrG [Vibrio tasmaniensis]TKG39878.1 type VI secretion system tip protein VgrG [Vibrio tasmaniensis]TKG40929.1 type VI secretion system tip protein VgrG [Vibrio tasmaniensis]TKG42402.1 type VI secretion system tip protein VgrG [Vibrio tasmaniensis]
MTDNFSPSASAIVAKDSKSNEHAVSDFAISEYLSKPFKIELTLISKNFSIDDQLGQKLSITRFINDTNNQAATRVFNGIVTQVQLLGMDSNLQYSSYRITLRPWFWLLIHTHSFRVYQNQSTKDIVSDVLTQAGFSGSFKAGTMPSSKREYCVQYDESDFDFVTRLLAEEGVHYFFQHSDSDHVMMLQDAQSPYKKSDIGKLDMIEVPSGNNPLLDKWMPQGQFHGASIELTSYDYSQTKLVSSKQKKSSHKIANNTKLTKQFYPNLGITGGMEDLASNLVKRRIEQLEQNYQTVEAEAQHDSFELGKWFSLSSHLDKDQLGDYLVTELHTSYSTENHCQTRLTLLDTSTPNYPSPTDKAKIHGLQSAIVAGNTAGEINQDEQGRVRIQFHWDTQTSGDKTSCYVRVAQMMAGNGYGAQFIPRVGQEVLVSFIDGDPDQPIITGSVYNSKNPPPYKEANSTKTGISTKLSGLANELYFDDKKDNELLYMHATKDFTKEIENNLTETIKGELIQKTTKQVNVSTEDNYTLNSDKAIAAKGKSISLEADDKIELKVGSSKITMSSSSISIEASNIDIKASSALNLEGMNVTSKATSANKISGVTTALEATSSNSIKGLSVAIKADTTLTAEGSLSAEFKSGLKGTFNGGVLGELKGAIVKVN